MVGIALRRMSCVISTTSSHHRLKPTGELSSQLQVIRVRQALCLLLLLLLLLWLRLLLWLLLAGVPRGVKWAVAFGCDSCWIRVVLHHLRVLLVHAEHW